MRDTCNKHRITLHVDVTKIDRTGSGAKGADASSQRTCEAAARPNMAGSVPSTGIVRTRKLGTICKTDTHS